MKFHSKRPFCLHSSTWVDNIRTNQTGNRSEIVAESPWNFFPQKWKCWNHVNTLWATKVPCFSITLITSISSRLPPWRVCCRCASTGTSKMQGCSMLRPKSAHDFCGKRQAIRKLIEIYRNSLSKSSEFYRRRILELLIIPGLARIQNQKREERWEREDAAQKRLRVSQVSQDRVWV